MRRPIYLFTDVHVPFRDIAHVLQNGPEAWLPVPAKSTGGAFQVDLQPEGVLSTPPVSALVTVDDPIVAQELVIRPISWHGAVAESLFPTVEADLELSAFGPDWVRLALAGTYRPPLSVIGAAADGIVGRHLAEAVVRRFVCDVAERLQIARTMAV